MIADADDTLLGDDGALRDLQRVLRQRRILLMVNSSRSVRSVLGSFHGRIAPVAVAGALGTELAIHGRRVSVWENQFAAWDAGAVRKILDGIGCTPHPDEHQRPAKVSYAVPVDRRRAVRHALAAGPAHRVIVSGVTDFDVIPRAAGKAAAARFAARLLGIPLERTATAGDSANDADLLAIGRPILVGNATPGLRAAVRDRGIRATRGQRARGVLEGLR